jgi:hypothetical protein
MDGFEKHIRACVRHFRNGEIKSLSTLLEIHFQGVDQVLGSATLLVSRLPVRVEEVVANMAVDDLRHKGIQRAAGCSNCMQNIGAFGVFLKRPNYGVYLTAKAAGAVH